MKALLLVCLLALPLVAAPVVVVGDLPEVSPYAAELEPRAEILAGSVWRYRGLIVLTARFEVVAVAGGRVEVRTVGTKEDPTRWTEADFRKHFRPVAFDPHH